MELASLKFAWQPGRLETHRNADVAAGVQRQSGGRIPSFLEDLSFFLLQPSTDWMRPTYIMEGNLLYLKSTD